MNTKVKFRSLRSAALKPKVSLRGTAIFGLVIVSASALCWGQESRVPSRRPELVAQTGHSDPVNSVALSVDGKTLASGSDDHTIKLWDVTSGTELRTLNGHSDHVNSVGFSADGKTLASGSEDETIKLWEIKSGRELRTLTGHSGAVISVALSVDGKTLASGSRDKTVKLWDLTSGTELRMLKGHSDSVNSVAFSSDGKRLASGSRDKAVKLWDVISGTELRTLNGHSDSVNSVAFSADGKTLASGSWDQTIKLWDVSSGTELRVLKGGVSNEVYEVAFSPDGKTLASGVDGGIVLWEITSGRKLGAMSEEYSITAHRAVRSVAFSADGKTLASGREDRTIKVWDVISRTELRTLAGHSAWINSVAFSVDGKTLASSSLDYTIKLWDTTSGREPRTLESDTYLFPSLAFSEDGKMLASAGGYYIKLWDVTSGRELRTLTGDYTFVKSVAFSPDGKTLASGSDGRAITLWDVTSGRQLRTLSGHSGWVTSVAFSPDGKTLASGSADYTIKLWEVTSGRELRTLAGHPGWVYSVAFSADGKTLASGSSDTTIKLWEVTSGRELRTLKGHSGWVNSVAFSVDGKTLASGSGDPTASFRANTIKLWEVTSGRELRTLTGHSNWVRSVAFSADGRHLVSGSRDARIRVWDTGSGEELASLIALDQNDWLVVTPDGLFDGSPNGWKQILWRFNSNTFDWAPVEAFYNEFYYPGLLADILAGKRPKPSSDISQKDRRQPQLKLELDDIQAGAQFAARNVKLKIDVAELPADKDHKSGSGAHDVRLFRNGSLVKLWRGDVLKGKGRATLETTIPIVAGENRLTAYAFNRDNIKSSDVTLIFTGADSLKRRGTAYILAVGVGKYANPNYNLDYTPHDATSFAAQLKLQQEKLREYESVEVSTLLNQKATKQNILAELKKLTAAVQPEDAVVVYFSGHGKADGVHFYLIPHDLGYSGPRDQLSAEGLRQIIGRSISDVELEEAFREIDAGQIFMIIDACNSGQALENKDEPRRGPMNTRGLAQLAYEKGIYIMAASQNVEEAFVSEKLKHSYLTFALVEEGLKTKVADENRDGQVTLREWFDYASTRVPKLRDETLQRKSLEEVTPTVKAVRRQRTQTPRPFYRRELEAQPFVVAKPLR